MRTLELTHTYEVSADRLWRLATDFDALAEVVRGKLTFTGLPQGCVQAGQKIDVMVSLFGKLPPQPYHMHVVEFDEAAMRLTSEEKGAGVKVWRHQITVEATPQGSRLTDRLEIDAGWLTGPMCLWARYLYSGRQAPRQRMLAEGRF